MESFLSIGSIKVDYLTSKVQITLPHINNLNSGQKLKEEEIKEVVSRICLIKERLKSKVN